MRRSSCGIVVVVFLLCCQIVSAHRPLFPSTGQDQGAGYRIPDIETSWAVYGTTSSESESVYRVYGPNGGILAVHLLVPVGEANEGSWPEFSVLGPEGVLRDRRNITSRPERFFEPFTQTSYYRLQTESIVLPSNGEYQVRVAAARPAKHVLSVGYKEKWSAKDALIFPWIWLRVRWWVSPWVGLSGLAIVAIFIACGIFLWRRLHRSASS